jgi:hypothetical protein
MRAPKRPVATSMPRAQETRWTTARTAASGSSGQSLLLEEEFDESEELEELDESEELEELDESEELEELEEAPTDLLRESVV